MARELTAYDKTTLEVIRRRADEVWPDSRERSTRYREDVRFLIDRIDELTAGVPKEAGEAPCQVMETWGELCGKPAKYHHPSKRAGYAPRLPNESSDYDYYPDHVFDPIGVAAPVEDANDG